MDAKKLFARLDADTWFFDLDGTLYSAMNKISQVFKAKYLELVMAVYGLDLAKAEQKLIELQFKHKTRLMRPALVRDGVPIGIISSFTAFRIDAKKLGIALPRKRRENLLAAVGERIVLTNSPESYAWQMLSALGVGDLFAQVIGAESMDNGRVFKPECGAYNALIVALGNGRRVVLVDDEEPNLDAAVEISHAIGNVAVSNLVTILVGNKPKSSTHLNIAHLD
ncbi:MAG: HAD family hydrolase [Candidatus Falkowbacteria bacterium]